MQDNSNLEIQLLSFDRPTELTERFYFLEMATLQATALLQQDRKIISAEIIAYTDKNEFIDKQTIIDFKTIGQFNEFFINNNEYYIHNCELNLDNDLTINSHDDGEVSIQIRKEQPDISFIDKIFDTYKLDKKLLAILKNNEGHYIAIDKESNLLNNFKDFDDYVENGRA